MSPARSSLIALFACCLATLGCSASDGGACEIDGDCQSRNCCVTSPFTRGVCYPDGMLCPLSTTDAGPRDASTTDAGETDAGETDAGVDASTESDSGTPDSGAVDAGTDAGDGTDAGTDAGAM